MNAKELGLQSAFPGQYLNAQGEPAADYEYGLTKREQFAAMAMQGALGGVPGTHLQAKQLARESVEYADALLAALAGEQP